MSLRRVDWGYIGRRLLRAVFVLWATFTISFFILYVIPGDPARLMLGGGGEATVINEEQLDEIRARFGFDQPLVNQYFRSLTNTVTGDLGTSYASGAPVSQLLRNTIGTTSEVVAFAMVLALSVGFGVGSAAAAGTPSSTWPPRRG